MECSDSALQQIMASQCKFLTLLEMTLPALPVAVTLRQNRTWLHMPHASAQCQILHSSVCTTL